MIKISDLVVKKIIGEILDSKKEYTGSNDEDNVIVRSNLILTRKEIDVLQAIHAHL